MLSKVTGDWRPILQVRADSPGFETNDAGFMQRTDILSAHAVMQYDNPRPTARFRERHVWFATWTNRNFDGDTLSRGALVEHFATLANYWGYRTMVEITPGAISDRLSRGGPAVRTPGGWSLDLEMNSDDRKRVWFEAEVDLDRNDDGSTNRELQVGVAARPRSNLLLSVNPILTRSREVNQYLTRVPDPAATATYGQRYVFAELEQRTFELATRVDWTLNARLSFQLYLQPFIASGDYHDPHYLLRPRGDDYAPYTAPVIEPDFNFRSVRGSAVARWEFRPGSALYVVWNENRADVEPIGDFSFSRDLRAIPTAPSHDVFLVKVSYWLPM
jgi:hypothetical protein